MMNFVDSRLTEDTKNFLENELENIVEQNLRKKIELLDKYLCLPQEGIEYKGLSDRITRALNDFANGESPLDVLNDLAITEQHLKSLVYKYDRRKYDEIVSFGEVFKNIIIFFGMTRLGHNGNLNLTVKPWEKERGMTLESKFGSDPNQYRWAVVYNYRNEDAHDVRDYKMYQDAPVKIFSILYVVLECTWKYRREIETEYADRLIFSGIDKAAYLDSIIREYEGRNLQNTFVVMSMVDNNYDNRRSDDVESGSANTISSIDLVKVLESKKCVKFEGEAGMGKTRLMRYLHYREAKEGRSFPVYIELKMLSDMNDTVKDLIIKESGLTAETCELLMKRGGMSLYLDGVNEILCSEKEKRNLCLQLNELPREYPETKILISDREHSYISVSRNIPSYLLVKLDESLVDEFVIKNCKTPDTAERIREILQEESYLYDIVKTPFMLETFINLVENNEYRPNSIKNESKLRARFVESLLKREFEEKLEVRAKTINLLLAHLFIKNDALDESESFSENQIYSKFNKCKDYYGFQVNSIEILELIEQMGILVKRNERYYFANEIYFSHFLYKAQEIILEL